MKIGKVCVKHKIGILENLSYYKPISTLSDNQTARRENDQVYWCNHKFIQMKQIPRLVITEKKEELGALSGWRDIYCHFFKSVERTINLSFYSHFSNNIVITQYQFRFQKEKSTESARMRIKNKIITNIENHAYAIGIFLDFRNAFCFIEHEILLKEVSCLPQGSILNPLLFLVYVNDMVSIPLTRNIIWCADDTIVFFWSGNLYQFEETSNTWLSKLLLWLKNNQLHLNTSITR